MSDPHKLAYHALAKALARLPGEVVPSRAMSQAVGARLQPLVARAVVNDLGKTKVSGWAGQEAEGRAVILKGGAVMIVRERRGAGLIRVLDRGRHLGDPGVFQGPGANRKFGTTSRTKSGKVRQVRAVKGKKWNGYTDPQGTWTDALQLMRAAAPAAVQEHVAAGLADKIREVVTGG
ncbi:MAG: hypothetical protein Q7V57_11280 [Actinomycetota bacterium]|nr:hypothetical protein [Actinomycetota bacterium]